MIKTPQRVLTLSFSGLASSFVLGLDCSITSKIPFGCAGLHERCLHTPFTMLQKRALFFIFGQARVVMFRRVE